MTVQAAVGVFDSGLGGLTVARAVRAGLPNERLVYLGDTARVPYGTRSPGTVCTYAKACARRLLERDIKLLVVACNTASAVALPELVAALPIPVLGVIEPGARAGVAASPGGRVGVLATAGTVASGAYASAIGALSATADVSMQAAPLLVPLAEEGWTEGQVPELVAARYLAPLIEAGVDSIVLGCTHYPLLRGVIESTAARLGGRPIPVVDSAQATADELASVLAREGLEAPDGDGPSSLELLVTDMPGRFREVAARFLGDALEPASVEQIDL